MARAADIDADMLAFWNGAGGELWVQRQEHTDIALTPITDALQVWAGARPGERVVDIGCGCGAVTIDLARAVGQSGRVAGLDISTPMLAEARRRASAAGIAHVDWIEADAATAALGEYDLLASVFGTMFFGDPAAAFGHMRAFAAPGARLAMVAWAALGDNPWMGVPMDAVRPHVPPRPAAAPHAPGMFAFADPAHVAGILAASGWAAPRFERLSVDLDIAAGRGLEEAVLQSTMIGAVNSWLRPQSGEVKLAAARSIREALAPHVDGASVRLPATVWLIASEADRVPTRPHPERVPKG